MQEEQKILPKFLNVDESFDKLLPDETPFASGLEWGINGNPPLGIGLDSQVGEGANVECLTPNRSNLLFGTPVLPEGYNINIGTYESYTTQEIYYFNYNGNGNHGIYVLSGNTFTWAKVIEDPELEFTDDPKHFIAEHRVSLRIVYNKQKEIVEKILTATDGNSWQKWILTMAAIATDGFNANVYPYWALKQPHFDRKELLQWPNRPPMINPVATAIPNTPADLGKPNRLIDQAWQFSCRFGNTDGRITVPGSYSDPVIIKSEDFLANPNFLPKNINVKFYAGSPMTEFIDVFMRKSAKKTTTVANTTTWSDWYLVERIYKFGVDPNVLSTPYWLRQNPWVNRNYDLTFNTIDYTFDGARLLEIVDQREFDRLQNDIPQLSYAQGVLDDKLALANNRVNYGNATTDLINKLEVTVQKKEIESCPVTLRKIKLYVYMGRDRGNFSAEDRARVHDKWFSQVAYTNGDDKTVRWGGLYVDDSAVGLQVDEATLFDLTFKDKEGFRFYLKGTPYFADCKWYVVKNDSAKTLVPIDGILDAESESNISFLNSTFAQTSYFVGVAEFLVPAGRYVATIGRHNIGNNGNYRSESTYIMGIANSRSVTYHNDYFLLDNPVSIAVLTPQALVSTYKEMEIDCTSEDFDPWGNGADTFYVCTPFIGSGRDSDFDGGQKNRWSWVEGYLRESAGNNIPVELYPYQFDNNPIGYNGQLTDKNGFFWGYSWGGQTRHRNISPVFSPNNFNCIQSPAFVFTVPNNAPDSTGWKPNNIGYVADYNGGQFGGANRVMYFGKVTNIDGSIGYSNIGVTIANGTTVYTDNNGEFVLIIHNGQFQKRVSNVYVNAGGNFRINSEGCGYVPLFNYSENLVACSLMPIGTNPCTGATVDTGRPYPTCLSVRVLVEGGSLTTLKENASYSLGFAMADLAGRLMPVNVFQDITIPSYLQTGEVVATYFQLMVKFALKIQLFNPDMKWFAPYVSPKTNLLKYLQWVGDKMEYIDSGGTVVSDPSTAIFCRVTIQSLYNYNLANNFSLLANWQFTPDDRVRILDNGEGQLFDVATYGEPIDLQIFGTNYNDAARNSGILTDGGNAPVSAPDLTNTPTGTQISFYVRYDARLDRLLDKTGFWIELYTPRQQTEKIPYSELKWYPVIDGEISEFTGFNGNIPLYVKPVQIDLTYWDTYLFNRNISIPDEGNKFFNHGFLSPNVSDAFGANLTSGGRFHFRDDNARQIWKIGNVIKSDSYVINGLINGLGSFRDNPQNSTNYDNTDFGQILAMISQRNVILFVCENDFFTTNYDFHFAFPNEQGVMVVNQDSGLSRPFQKIGNNFGVTPDQTSSIIIIDKYVFWYDSKNEAFIMCDYKSARDVSDIEDEKGRKYGINSYIAEKTDFISNWNANHSRQERFDVITGVDVRTNRVYLTFRPRRNNSNKPQSYVTNRRNIDLKNQETVCFDIEMQRWVPGANYTPESYGKLRGAKSGVEMITFAAGKPYYHLNTPNTSYLNYYGVQTSPVVMVALNMTPEIVKIFMGIAQDILPNALRVDLVYDNELYSYSYLPANMIAKKENVFYGSLLRDLSSYNSPTSTLVDGKRIFGRYAIIRFVGQVEKLSEYFQLSNIFYILSDSPNNKK